MNKPASRLTLLAGVLATACVLTVPPAHGANDDGKADKKKKAEADLKKYDKNANGKLDPDEEAAMKADAEKQKSGKKRKN